MFDFLRELFSGEPFMPHRHCYADSSTMIALHVVSDSLICLAYYSIPAILIYFVAKRRDVPFNWIFRMFGMFIFACGTTHLMEVVTLWDPMYRLSGLIKAWTAIISIATVVALIPLLPKALALPSLAATAKRLEETNRSLERTTSDLTRSNRELEQFAYVASHDLQEPLRMVSAYLELLERRAGNKLSEEEQRFVGFAIDGATRMRALILDLLAFSRAGAQTTKASLGVGPVLDEALGNLAAKIAESGAVITRDPLPTVMADRTQLLQVLQNLIGNALKFHGTAAPRIHVGATSDGTLATLSVRDNGIGIAPEYQDRVFQLFQRLHSREEYPGTGIGLAICKKIIESHGGRMTLVSHTGAGSTFSFTLPLATAAAPRGDQG
jgi:signal transduction histidine kinase